MKIFNFFKTGNTKINPTLSLAVREADQMPAAEIAAEVLPDPDRPDLAESAPSHTHRVYKIHRLHAEAARLARIEDELKTIKRQLADLKRIMLRFTKSKTRKTNFNQWRASK